MLNLFNLTDTHVNVNLELEGTTYQLEHFEIEFEQSIDFKGQPQHEVSGGRLHLGLTQSVGEQMYEWARKATMLKNGTISFYSENRGTVLEVQFQEAYCTQLHRVINSYTGTYVTLEISPRNLSLNGITHNNEWRR